MPAAPAVAEAGAQHRAVLNTAIERIAGLQQHVTETLESLATHIRAELEKLDADLDSVPAAVKSDLERGFAWVRDHL